MFVKCCGRVGICNGLHKFVAGYRLPVMALKVQFHAHRKTFTPNQGLHHANNFRAFFVNGDGVEIVDLHVAVRANRVRHGTSIFGKLHGAQQADVFNTLDRTR